MASKSPYSLPLYERKFRKNTIPRAIELVILLLLLSLLFYRLSTLKNNGFPWLLAFLCETWFTFSWILIINIKWNQLIPRTFPERLLRWSPELPPVDIFVTTADPVLEPPILTVNTVLSLLAVDYPSEKLACYVSDDGASPVTFYCLVEASKFARLWVPFCRKYKIGVRAPFRYFKGRSNSEDGSSEFQEEWKMMKDEYEKLCQKIEAASQEDAAVLPSHLTGDFASFSNIERRNHSTIIKVIWENKDGVPNCLPHLIYISREKRPKHPHHFKAGAMNVLTRVSGVMTNAPFMLNVDCDMFVNNPQSLLHAMCYLLGTEDERESGFVQFPQQFYDGLKDDPYGNQLRVLYAFIGRGIAGLQGPFYGGTGCFHRRKVIYGLSPNEEIPNGKLRDEELEKAYGKSARFTQSAAQILSGKEVEKESHGGDLSSYIEAAYQVAACSYEQGTNWGEKVGWIYGSATEDVLTGLNIHARGWKSAFCTPDPPSFLGCAPSGGPAALTQMKRWSTGLLEIMVSRKNPIVSTITGGLQLRQYMAYLWILTWGFRSIFEISYAALPAYCIITNSHFLPKMDEAAFFIPLSIAVIYNIYTLSEYIRVGESFRAWWNNQRMWRVISMTSWLFGLLSVILKLLGLSETMFEVTKKDQTTDADESKDGNVGRFTFDDSPFFVPGIAILLVNLIAIFCGLFGIEVVASSGRGNGFGMGEVMCSIWVVLIFWAFLKGLFANGRYGIPSSVILRSGALALLFIHLCKLSVVYM